MTVKEKQIGKCGNYYIQYCNARPEIRPKLKSGLYTITIKDLTITLKQVFALLAKIVGLGLQYTEKTFIIENFSAKQENL